ncbi:MAG: inositol monophosphatase family protein [Acidobacteriota bacterium]
MSSSPSPWTRPEDWKRVLSAGLEACAAAGAVHRQYFRREDLAVETKEDETPVTASDRGAEAAIRQALREGTPELGVLGEEEGQQGDQRDRWVVDPLDGTKNFVAGLPYFAVLLGLELDGRRVLGLVHAPLLDSAAGGRTWWAVRGQGAFGGLGTVAEELNRPLRASSTSRVSDAFVTHGGLKHIHGAGFWPGFTELVQRARRSRGFGDWWGHVLVAEGRCDAMVEGAVAFHDVAAVEVLVEEAGGGVGIPPGARVEPGYGQPYVSAAAPLLPELMEVLGLCAEAS